MGLDKFHLLSNETKSLAAQASDLERTLGDQVNSSSEYRAVKKRYHETKIALINLVAEAGVDKVETTANDLRKRIRSTSRPAKYETGIEALDRKLNGGIELGSLVQIAGQSFVGKTHLTIEILSNVVMHKKAVFYNFEMGDYRIVDKLETLMNNDIQWNNLIINSEDREINDLVADIDIHAKQGVKYFAIDSRMKIEVKTNEPEHLKIASITKALSKVVQKNDIIVLLINQMSNESIKDKTLTFKGSGDSIYDTDLAFFYIKNDDTGERMLMCNKNRQADGNEFKVKLQLSNEGRTIGVIDEGDEPKRLPYANNGTIPVQTTEYNHNEMGVY